MLDFWTYTVPTDVEMAVDAWTFSPVDEYCYVDHYTFECTDPNGATYSFSSSDGDALAVDTAANESGDATSLCSAFDLTDLKDRNIGAGAADFTFATHEGTYSLKMTGQMKIAVDDGSSGFITSGSSSVQW